MLPKINNKSLMECKEEDFQMILNDPDYRENQYLEYKQTFAFLEIPKDKKTQRAEKITEFRNDVCAFANAEGGYLIYGGYTGALKAPVRCFGNHLSGKRKSLFRRR